MFRSRIYLVNTSADRWQVVWKVEGFGSDDAERLMRHLARETGADPAATDSSRVLRLLGFLSHKHGAPFLVRVQPRATKTYNPNHFPQVPSGGARRASANRPFRSGGTPAPATRWTAIAIRTGLGIR